MKKIKLFQKNQSNILRKGYHSTTIESFKTQYIELSRDIMASETPMLLSDIDYLHMRISVLCKQYEYNNSHSSHSTYDKTVNQISDYILEQIEIYENRINRLN